MSPPAAHATPLHRLHIALGARMMPFGGFDMPLQYQGILIEHHAARHGAVLFDTCHMGEFIISGRDAVATLERLVTCNIADMETGACRYGLMCNADGGTVDDLLLYREASDRFMMVVNAGTQDADFAWITRHCTGDTRCEDISTQTAKIDLQGPQAPAVLDAMIPGASGGLRYFRFRHLHWQGEPVCISRTGYTGERGYEIYLPPAPAVAFWEQAMRSGAVPAGLGARDTLRIEAGLPLYGHEFSATRNATHTAPARALATGKYFIGAEALRSPGAQTHTLAGLRMAGRQTGRPGDAVLDLAGHPVGEVTSGCFAPSLGIAAALAIVEKSCAAPGTALHVNTARKPLDCLASALPLYAQGSARQP